MNLKPLLVCASLSMASIVDASAGAQDYTFVPITTEVTKGDDVTIAVRLMHKPSGKPVSGATIIRTRIDMGPEGMAEMAVPVKPSTTSEPGVYAFKTDLSMAGRWAFSLAAKTQGEPETIVGKVLLNVKE